jgi:hypothetical protein
MWLIMLDILGNIQPSQLIDSGSDVFRKIEKFPDDSEDDI